MMTIRVDVEQKNSENQKSSPIRRFVRYGVIVILAIAVVTVSGWVLQSRTEAKSEPEESVELRAYVPSNANESQVASNVESNMAPVEAVTSPVESAADQPIAQGEPVLVPTPTPVSPDNRNTASAQTVAVTQPELVSIVVGRDAALYDMPAGDILEPLSTGTDLMATGRSSDSEWVYARTANNKEGWVNVEQIAIFNAQNLTIMDAAAETEIEDVAMVAELPGEATRPVPGDGEETIATVSLTESRLNIRSGPGMEYVIVSKAYPNEQFRALARNDGATWVQIELDYEPDTIAWVSADYVTLSEPIRDLSVSNQAVGTPVVSAPTASTGSTSSVNSTILVSNQTQPSSLSGNLAIQDGTSDMIHVYDLDTGSMRTLTSGYDPAISPDGSTVAFVRQGGDNGIYLIGIDGSNERRIFNGREGLSAPSWSPDGGWLTFVFLKGTYDCRELGLGICYPDNNPFLKSLPAGSQPIFGLSVVDFNGENYRDLPALESAQAPDWSANGIVYSADKGIEITQFDPADNMTRRIIGKSFYQDPVWQPGGDRIIFQSKEGTHWEIFAVNVDGSGLTALTRPATALVDELPHNVAPTWSPDGQHILFLSSRDSNHEHMAWRLWIMNPDGSDQRPLGIELPLNYRYAHEQMVSWGPPV